MKFAGDEVTVADIKAKIHARFRMTNMGDVSFYHCKSIEMLRAMYREN
jgi:hypothetical protein